MPMTLELRDPVLKDVDAGTDFSLKVAATAPSGCELAGTPFEITDAGRVVRAGEWPALEGDDRHTGQIVVTAPERIGEFEWTLVAHPRSGGDVGQEGASLTFSFRTRRHGASLAVWGHPSPVVIGERFKLHVGARCTAACVLAGEEIEILDGAGAIVARGVFGETPWAGTEALYWTSVEIAAPSADGCYAWRARFSAAGLRLPHEGASAAFSFVTVARPEYRVSIEVVEQGTATPVDDAQVRLGVHRASTDETGVATFDVPAGTHRLLIWKPGCDPPEKTVDVTRSENVRVEVAVLPPDDPDAHWQG